MAVNWMLPVRGLQAVLSLVVLGLFAYVAQWWTSHWRQTSPVEINFMIFSPVWSLVSVVALIVVPMKFSHLLEQTVPKVGLLVLELFTMLCWFGGFVALAVFLSDRICFGTVCEVAKAGTAISAFSWVAWAVTFGVGVWKLFKKGGLRGGSGSGMGVKQSKVEMHQGV